MSAAYPLGQSFPTLGARIVYAILASFPEYEMWVCGVSDESQRQMHEFLTHAVETVYRDPALIGIPEQPDRCFPERWLLNNSDPELMDAMKKVQKKFFDWVGVLYKLSVLGEVREDCLIVAKSAWRISAKTLAMLSTFGLQNETTPDAIILRCAAYPALFPAWKQRSTVSTEGYGVVPGLMRFLYGVYDQRAFRASQFFGKLYDDPSWLAALEEFFERRGYRLGSLEGDPNVSWEKMYPDKERGYLRIAYRSRDRLQMVYEFRVPGFRKLLSHYDAMDTALQALCFSRTKVCDGCGYCTQMDKSGKRSRLAIPLIFNGEEKRKCPLWPYFTWNEPDETTVAEMESLFDFAEHTLY